MNKKFVIFMCLMILVVMGTSVVYAASISKTENITGKNFSRVLVGDVSRCGIATTDKLICVGLGNYSSSSKYMFSQVRENKYNIGWTSNYNSYSCNVAAGKVSNMYSSRNIDLNGYYYCIGKCYTEKIH